ncbi:hypothetical protein ACFE04_022563 [Oxalis oulophora]
MNLVNVNGTNNLKASKYSTIQNFNKKEEQLDYFVCQGIFVIYRTLKSPLFLNPITQEVVEQPDLPPENMGQANLYGHHHRDVYGLGFDFKSRIHKVVYFSMKAFRPLNKAQVFTLGSKDNSWREIPAEFLGFYVLNIEKEELTTTLFPKAKNSDNPPSFPCPLPCLIPKRLLVNGTTGYCLRYILFLNLKRFVRGLDMVNTRSSEANVNVVMKIVFRFIFVLFFPFSDFD